MNRIGGFLKCNGSINRSARNSLCGLIDDFLFSAIDDSVVGSKSGSIRSALNKSIRLMIFMTLFLSSSHAQPIKILTQGNGVSLRGMSVVTDNILWVSGSKGTTGRSTDGGQTWEWNQVKGFEKREFRDIEAFDSLTAVVLAIAEPGAILKTTDGGKNWIEVYSDSTKGIFLDAFHFTRNGEGTVIGDPINGKAYLAATKDFGNTWSKLQNAPAADSGEACFASSGTNIISVGNGSYYFVTGGLVSRLHSPGFAPLLLPLLQGKESTGANSIAVLGNKAVIVGGDFARDTAATANCVLVKLGKTPVITSPLSAPHGYRSCVTFIDTKRLITCGTSGVDVSSDGGRSWQLISKESFHVCQKAKNGKAIYLAGGNGRIARYVGK